MRLFERTVRAMVRDKRLHNKCHKIFWKCIGSPIATFDLGYVLIKTKGNIDEDAFWNELTHELYSAGYIDVVRHLYGLEYSYRRAFLEEA